MTLRKGHNCAKQIQDDSCDKIFIVLPVFLNPYCTSSRDKCLVQVPVHDILKVIYSTCRWSNGMCASCYPLVWQLTWILQQIWPDSIWFYMLFCYFFVVLYYWYFIHEYNFKAGIYTFEWGFLFVKWSRILIITIITIINNNTQQFKENDWE